MAHFLSKCYNSKTDEDTSTKPTANGDKIPKFSMAGSRCKISHFELFNSGLNLPRNFDHFLEILVQVNKAVLGKMYKRLRTKDPSFQWINVCKVNSLFNCVDIVNNFLLQITFETKNNVPNLLSEPKLGSSRCNRQNSHSEGGIFINFELSKGIVDLSLFLLRGKQSETFIGLLEDIYWTHLLSFLSVYRSA